MNAGKIILSRHLRFKVNNGDARTLCEICSKLTINSRSGVFILNFEQI